MILNARNVLLVHEWNASAARMRPDTWSGRIHGMSALKGQADSTKMEMAAGTAVDGGASIATTLPTAIFEPEEYERWDGLS
jgi:hypothetical protein